MSSIVKFEGIWGVGDETPHCYLLTIDEFTILLDCGWDEKFDKDFIDRLTKIAPKLDCILLSHPDLLHIGALPYLVGKLGVSCPIYATIPVYKLGQLFLYDCYQSYQNCEDFEHYTLDDVDLAFENIQQIKFNQSIPMKGKGLGLFISAHPAGHMLGGSMWRVSRDGEEDILYAVDINHKKDKHLGACELEQFSRPSILITDAFNASYRQEKSRDRDAKFFALLQETCRSGGNVLVATDTAGRVLELAYILEQVWANKDSGMATYSLAILSNTAYHVVQFAKTMIEWMAEKIIKTVNTERNNPFNFKHVKLCHSMDDLNRLPAPKVVLASSPDLESGFSRELFIEWAINPKNTIILTNRTGPGTLCRVLIDNPVIQTFKLVEKKRVRLDGDELERYMKSKLRERKARIKDELLIDDSDSEQSDEEVSILSANKHDIILVNQKPGLAMKSKKHHPMYPYTEDKFKADDYGEYVNVEDFVQDIPFDHNKDNIRSNFKQAFRPQDDEDDIIELDDHPTKCISQTVTVRVAAQIVFNDFEGRSDGESVLKILESVHPGRVILVRGLPTDLHAFGHNLRTVTKAKVIVPKLGQIIDASIDNKMFQVKLSETLVSQLLLQPASGDKGIEVAWIDGAATYKNLNAMETDESQALESSQDEGANPMAPISDIATLTQVPLDEAPFHDSVFINEIRLSDFKQVLARAGIEAEFSAGILWCSNGTIALKRQETGTVAIEGCLSEDYFEIRDLLYSQYAIV